MAIRQEFTVDSENSDAVSAWSDQRTSLLRALAAAQDRVAALDAALASAAAVAARAEVAAASDALARAHADATAAQERFDAADAEARRFEANELATAQAAVDAATLTVSQTLATVLRDASASVALTATVDGLALRERYRTATAKAPPRWNHTTIPFPATASDVVDPQLALPTVDSSPGSDYSRLLGVLDRLDERVDAVADLVTAESVHQLVAGNPTRSGGSLAVAAQGRVPDEFDVIRTPRPGYDVTHRLAVVIDPARPAPWTAAQPGPAARLDPVTTAWLSRLLPDPAHVAVPVFLIGPPSDPGGGDDGGGGGDGGDGGPVVDHPPGTEQEPPPPVNLTMADLDLDVFGWIRVAASAPEFEYRLNAAAQRRWRAVNGEPPPEGHLEIGDTGVAGIPGGPSVLDLLAAARNAGALLTSVRALDPADLAHPAGPDAPPLAAAAVELVAQRVRAVEMWLGQLVTGLDAAPPDAPSTVDLLLRAASAGAAEAVPTPDADTTLIAALCAAAAARLRPRLAATPFAADPADPAGSLTRARARADELCGVRLPVAATFPNPLDATATADLAAGANRLTGTDRASVRAWLLAHARVRPAIGSFVAALDLAEALGAAEQLDPRVTQVPTRASDAWIGTASPPRAGAVGLVVQSGYGDRPSATVSGLLFDAFTQAVPADGHDTGVAFHYDQPDAAPPQALLVAVHPDPNPQRAASTWDLDTLLDVVTTTLALAQDRATAAELRTTAGVEVPDA